MSELDGYLGLAMVLSVQTSNSTWCDIPKPAKTHESKAPLRFSVSRFGPCPDIGPIHEIGVGRERYDKMRIAGNGQILGFAELEILYTLL